MVGPRLKKVGKRYYGYFYDKRQEPKYKSYPLRVTTKKIDVTMLRRLESEYTAGTFDPWHSGAFPASRSGTYRQTVMEFVAFQKAEQRRPKTVDHSSGY